MSETYNLGILSERFGRGFVCFFDEPFGEQTPFEWAGGFAVTFDNGFNEGGILQPEELAKGLDAWLAKKGWRRMEAESFVSSAG
jgi:hypothetical protein